MFLLTIFSGVLFVVPVLVTFGVYFGLEHAKILRCGLSCHHTGNATVDDPTKLVRTTFCQKSYAIAPPPGRYICTSSSSAAEEALPAHSTDTDPLPIPPPTPLVPASPGDLPQRSRCLQAGMHACTRCTHARPQRRDAPPLPWFSHPLTLAAFPPSQPQPMVRRPRPRPPPPGPTPSAPALLEFFPLRHLPSPR